MASLTISLAKSLRVAGSLDRTRNVRGHRTPHTTNSAPLQQHWHEGYWTICHTSHLSHYYFGRFVKSFALDETSQKRNSDLGIDVGRYGRFGTIIFSRDNLSQLNFISGRFVMDLYTFGMHAC